MLTNVPGSDILSKFVIADPQVKELILQYLELTDKYVVVDNLFKDGSEADILMIPQKRATMARPPILIEIQLTINRSFTGRLLGYCSKIMERYGVLPLVIVFNTNGFQSKALKSSFQKENDYFTAVTDLWAKKLYLFNLESVNDSLNMQYIPHINILTYFFCKKEVNIKELELKDNRFMIELYEIAARNSMASFLEISARAI